MLLPWGDGSCLHSSWLRLKGEGFFLLQLWFLFEQKRNEAQLCPRMSVSSWKDFNLFYSLQFCSLTVDIVTTVTK